MRTSRYWILFLLLACSALGIHAQNRSQKIGKTLSRDEQKLNLENFVNKLRPAFFNRDYATLAAEMFRVGESDFPEENFDEEQMTRGIAVIKQLFERTAADGMTFAVRLKSPLKIVSVKERLFAVVPQTTTISIREGNRLKQSDGRAVKPGKYIAKGFILAIFADNSGKWKFYNALSEATSCACVRFGGLTASLIPVSAGINLYVGGVL